jgi:hypothetical protein
MRKIVGLDFLCMVLVIGLVYQPVMVAQQNSLPNAPSAESNPAAPTPPLAAPPGAFPTAAQNTPPSAPPGTSSSAIPNTPLAEVSVPVPRQISAAKTIFIANAGDKTNLFPDVYSGGPDRPYVQFYSDMQTWGRYQLVSSPDQADLVFQISLVNHIASELLSGNNAGYWNGAEWHDPQLRLNILDPKTHISLWELTSHIQSTAGLKRSRDRQFDLAMGNLVSELEQLSTQTTTTENSSLLRQKGHSTRIKVMTILAIAAVAGGVASFAYIASQRNKLPPLPQLPPATYPVVP